MREESIDSLRRGSMRNNNIDCASGGRQRRACSIEIFLCWYLAAPPGRAFVSVCLVNRSGTSEREDAPSLDGVDTAMTRDPDLAVDAEHRIAAVVLLGQREDAIIVLVVAGNDDGFPGFFLQP